MVTVAPRVVRPRLATLSAAPWLYSVASWVLLLGLLLGTALAEEEARAVEHRRYSFWTGKNLWSFLTSDPLSEVIKEGQASHTLVIRGKTLWESHKGRVQLVHGYVLDFEGRGEHARSKASLYLQPSSSVTLEGERVIVQADEDHRVELELSKSRSFLQRIASVFSRTGADLSAQEWLTAVQGAVKRLQIETKETSISISKLRSEGKEPVVDAPKIVQTQPRVTYANPWDSWRDPLKLRSFLNNLWFKVPRLFKDTAKKDKAKMRRHRNDISGARFPSELYTTAQADHVHVTWINHAFFIVSVNGVVVFTDPTFADDVAKRPKMALSQEEMDQLPAPDVIIISHDHSDHYHPATLKALLQRRQGAALGKGGRPVRILVGKGLGRLVRRDVSLSNDATVAVVEEMMWGDKSSVVTSRSSEDFAVEFVAVPVAHWGLDVISKMPLTSIDEQLWSGFLIRGLRKTPSSDSKRWENTRNSVIFLGDTGYTPAFQHLALAYGGLENTFPDQKELFLSLAPIGNSEPRQFYRPWHETPQAAVHLHSLFGVKHSVVMHFGCLPISTFEQIEFPPLRAQFWAEHDGLSVLQRYVTPKDVRMKDAYVKAEAPVVEEAVVVPAQYETYTFAVNSPVVQASAGSTSVSQVEEAHVEVEEETSEVRMKQLLEQEPAPPEPPQQEAEDKTLEE